MPCATPPSSPPPSPPFGLSGTETLRNPNGVYMKLMNYRSHDPRFTGRGRKGLSRGNKDEKFLWTQFAGDLLRLRVQMKCAG